MESIKVERMDFHKILNTAEILIDKVEQIFQDEIVRNRVNDIKTSKIKGKTEKDYNEYLKKRGIKFQ
ncbi:MAG: hypothetical protein KJ646_04355 [Nanoarchaeota archaeon]|nr:hypothetical protein [Nanoarchaeota archaeon]